MATLNGYELAEIDVPGSLETRAYKINDKGQIVGDFTTIRPEFYNPQIIGYNEIQGRFIEDNGTILTSSRLIAIQVRNVGDPVPKFTFGAVGLPNTSITTAYDINNNGKTINYDDFVKAGFPTSISDGINLGASFSTRGQGISYGINDLDQIVGTNGFLDTKSGSIFTPIVFPGSSSTISYDINNLSQIIGSYSDSSGTHGFLYSGGIFTSIDFPSSENTRAYGLNDLGQIVGSFTDATGTHGFLKTGDKFSVIDFAGATAVFANGINNSGEIVGYYNNIDGSHAFTAVPIDSKGPDSLSIQVSEDSWLYHPDAQFVVKVDGEPVGRVQSVSASHAAGQSQTIVLHGNFADAKEVVVQFLNDQYGGPDQDVNLYVHSLSLNGVSQSGSEAVLDPNTATQLGSTAQLYKNGSATFNLAPDTLTFRVSEDAWTYHSDAQFVVKVDGQQVGGVLTTHALHSTGAYDDISLKGNFADAHQVTVEFINDQYGGSGQDVNLYVNSISLNGQSIQGSEAVVDPSSGTHVRTSAELFRNGSAVFNVEDLHHAGLLM